MYVDLHGFWTRRNLVISFLSFLIWPLGNKGPGCEVRATKQLTVAPDRKQGYPTWCRARAIKRRENDKTWCLLYFSEAFHWLWGFCFLFSFGWKNLLSSTIENHLLVIISVPVRVKGDMRGWSTQFSIVSHSFSQYFGVSWLWDTGWTERLLMLRSLPPGGGEGHRKTAGPHPMRACEPYEERAWGDRAWWVAAVLDRCAGETEEVCEQRSWEHPYRDGRMQREQLEGKHPEVGMCLRAWVEQRRQCDCRERMVAEHGSQIRGCGKTPERLLGDTSLSISVIPNSRAHKRSQSHLYWDVPQRSCPSGPGVYDSPGVSRNDLYGGFWIRGVVTLL